MSEIATGTPAHPSHFTIAPAPWLSPTWMQRINRLRLAVDIIGVTLVRLFLSLVQNTAAHSLLGIYNIVAWIVILTVDPKRLPEATTTRHNQRASWVYVIRWIPLLVIICGVSAVYPHTSTRFHLSVGILMGMIFTSYMDELLFRNVLQVKFRQAGLPVWAEIALQSTGFSAAIWLDHAPDVMVISAWIIGVVNGDLVYRFRSLWAPFAFSLLWHLSWMM